MVVMWKRSMQRASDVSKLCYLPCIRRELLKFKLTNQNSASGKNCAIRRHANCLHSDWLDRWTFAQPSLVTLSTVTSLNSARQKSLIVLTINLPIHFIQFMDWVSTYVINNQDRFWTWFCKRRRRCWVNIFTTKSLGLFSTLMSVIDPL